jgi:uncharacterized membrane protein
MMDLIVKYLLAGTVFMFLMDTLLRATPDSDQFNNKERFQGIIFWPIWVLVFVVGLIKEIIDRFRS